MPNGWLESRLTLDELDEKDKTFVLGSLEQLSKARLFVHYATGLEWLIWLHQQRVLDWLFDTKHTLSDTQRLLAEWVARHFVVQHSDEVFNIILRHGQDVNDDFWILIVWQLTHGEPKPDAKVMAKWVHFLLRRVPADAEGRNSLDFLLKTCAEVDATSAALAVLDYLLTPTSRLDSSFGMPSETKEKTKHEVRLRGDIYWVKEAWEEYFSKNLDVFWMTLEPILQKHLVAANRMNQDFGHANEEWDSHSFSRSAVEPHQQDEVGHEIDRLIDAARDLLDYVFEVNPSEGSRIADKWYATGVPLLKRIAIHGMAKADQIGPEEKIGWLLNSEALDYSVYKTESFLLFKIAFPQISEETQQRVIDRALKGPKPLEGMEEDADRYEVYILLYWLHSVAPDSKIAAQAFKDYQAKNPQWGPREHPDHDTWVSSEGRAYPESPVSAEQLKAEPPQKHLELILTLERSNRWSEPGRDGLLMQLQRAVTLSFDWSSLLADLLIERQEWKVDVWRSIVDGWIESSHSDSEWIKMFELLSSTENLLETIDPIARLLSEGVKLTDGGISLEVLEKAEDFSDMYWSALVGHTREWEADRGWLDEAINRPAGTIAEFWVQALSKRDQAAGDDWAGLPEAYKQRLLPILTDESYSAQLARVIFGSRLQFFFALDPDWTKEYLVPLFNWDNDKLTAEQVWHGFIFWGAIPPPLHDDFRGLLTQTVRLLETEHEELKVSLFKFVLGLTWSHETDSDWRQWFYEVLKTTTEKDRVAIGHQIHIELGSMEDSVKSKFWTNWLRQYWSDRNQANPVALSAEEADQIIEWLPRLEPVFTEAVEQAVNTTGFVLYHCRVYYNLAKSDLPKTYPADVNKLLVHLLERAPEDFLHSDYVNQIYNTLHEVLPPTDLEPLLNQLIRLGCRIE